MAEGKFMTAGQVRSEVIPNEDFDESLINNKILLVQRKYLRDLLGEDFYIEIYTQNDATPSTLTSDNTTLLNDYIKPMLAHYVIYECFPQIKSNITSSGIVTLDHEFTNPASREDYAALRNQILAHADDLRAELIHYIKKQQEDNSSKFPLYEKKDNYQNKYGIITY
jgi:hypothetical protein